MIVHPVAAAFSSSSPHIRRFRRVYEDVDDVIVGHLATTMISNDVYFRSPAAGDTDSARRGSPPAIRHYRSVSAATICRPSVNFAAVAPSRLLQRHFLSMSFDLSCVDDGESGGVLPVELRSLDVMSAVEDNNKVVNENADRLDSSCPMDVDIGRQADDEEDDFDAEVCCLLRHAASRTTEIIVASPPPRVCCCSSDYNNEFPSSSRCCSDNCDIENRRKSRLERVGVVGCDSVDAVVAEGRRTDAVTEINLRQTTVGGSRSPTDSAAAVDDRRKRVSHLASSRRSRRGRHARRCRLLQSAADNDDAVRRCRPFLNFDKMQKNTLLSARYKIRNTGRQLTV